MNGVSVPSLHAGAGHEGVSAAGALSQGRVTWFQEKCGCHME